MKLFQLFLLTFTIGTISARTGNQNDKEGNHNNNNLAHSVGVVSSGGRNLNNIGVNYRFFHNGHCAEGWMGNNQKVKTVQDCALLCSEREQCGYFAYNLQRGKCATYSVSQGCPDDGIFPNYEAYEIVTSPSPDKECPDNCEVWYDGCNECGCSGDSPNKVESCTEMYCFTDEEAFCMIESSAVPPSEVYFEIVHEGQCASEWIDDSRKVDTIDECAIICREYEECGYFAYDDSHSYTTNCAIYFDADGCPADKLDDQFIAYRIVPYLDDVDGECDIKTSCRDCLGEDFTIHCAWVPDLGCVDSDDVIPEFPYYEYSEFMSVDKICTLAATDTADSEICGQQKNCGPCTSTVLSDGNARCQWHHSEDGGYCGSTCDMFGCGDKHCNDI